MIDINNPEHVALASLYDLRERYRDAIQALPESVQDVYRDTQFAAQRRDEKERVTELIEEFTSPFCGHFNKLYYEAAFKTDWVTSYPELYQARWWINEFRGACYFIFNDDVLQYIGSASTGMLGRRIWHTNHRDYKESTVDVVLFDRHWWHYSLAFEAFVISRLKPLGNRQFVDSWVAPLPPWHQMWKKPECRV